MKKLSGKLTKQEINNAKEILISSPDPFYSLITSLGEEYAFFILAFETGIISFELGRVFHSAKKIEINIKEFNLFNYIFLVNKEEYSLILAPNFYAAKQIAKLYCYEILNSFE